MVLHKFKIDLVFILSLDCFLQNINVDRLISINKIFELPKPILNLPNS